MSLKSISIPLSQGKKAKFLLVALHGWGANSQDLAPLTSEFELPEFQFIFPDAPYTHPQLATGKAWYDLNSNDFQGLDQSRQTLSDWIKSLEKTTGVPLSRTFLAGFSQGGAMTLDVGLTLPLAGLCSLSGYLHSPPQVYDRATPPVLIVHGRQDSVVPVQAAQKARDTLRSLGVEVEYQEFNMDHEIIPEVLTLMKRFILANESG
ncbi:MAG: alpha/beta hydrolase [Xenococcaceae cyanobacterium]